MKAIYFSVLLVFCTSSSFAQRNCKDVSTGKFSVKADGMETFITRTTALQTEEIPALKTIMSFDITWINECTYILKNAKIIKTEGEFGKYLNEQPKDAEIKVEITEVGESSYKYNVSSNFSEMVWDHEATIISK